MKRVIKKNLRTNAKIKQWTYTKMNQRTDTGMNQRINTKMKIKINNLTGSDKEMSQRWNLQFDLVSKINSHFGCTNIIFADCITLYILHTYLGLVSHNTLSINTNSIDLENQINSINKSF